MTHSVGYIPLTASRCFKLRSLMKSFMGVYPQAQREKNNKNSSSKKERRKMIGGDV